MALKLLLLSAAFFCLCPPGIRPDDQLPSESQCRPYIEKALKGLERAAESSEEPSLAPAIEISEEPYVDRQKRDVGEAPPGAAADSAEDEGEDAEMQGDAPAAESEESGEVELAEEAQSGEETEEEAGGAAEEAASAESGEPSAEEATAEGASAEAAAEASEESAEEASEETERESAAGGASEEAEGESAEDTSVEAKQASAEEASEESTEEASEEAEQESAEEASEEAKQESAEEASEEAKQESAEEASEEVKQESAEEASEEAERESAEEASEEAERESAEEASERVEEASEEDKEEAAEEVSEEASDEVKEEATDEASERVEEETIEEASEEEEKEETASDEASEEGEQEKPGESSAEAAEEASEDVEEASAESAETVAESAQAEEEAASEAEEEAARSEEAMQADEAASPEDEVASEEASAAEEPKETEAKAALDEIGQLPEAVDEAEPAAAEETAEESPEEDLLLEIDIPENLRSREHVAQILRLDEESTESERLIEKSSDSTLRELKRLYDGAIKPLEILYKYRDLSNRHFGDPEIFSKPLVLFMGPWSGGKSSLINYLTDNEFTEWSLRTGAEPSPAYFNILMHGKEPEVLDGTQLAADWTFSGLQKFGQGLEERLRGLKLPNKLLERVNIVEIPGILEVRKQVSRVFPFNDACQWFIDRADVIFLVYDPSKLDVGPETEAILDQLKGREAQTRILLNKGDQVKPEELMRVQSALIWNISPLMSSAQPPVMYTTSLWSMPYEVGAPARLLQSQERAFLKDLRAAIDKRVENKIASARRFAVRVRNHAKMVDCYLTTYYNHKTIFANKKVVAEAIVDHPQNYHIYEGLSTLTNISRYDLPDPETYADFFRLNPLYEFQQLAATCTYFRGCPINRLDVAIAYDLPELVGKYKKMVESATPRGMPKS